MLEHETDQYTKERCLQPNIHQDKIFNDLNDAKEVRQIESTRNIENHVKSPRIISNPILESYAELKAWTNATESNFRYMKDDVITYKSNGKDDLTNTISNNPLSSSQNFKSRDHSNLVFRAMTNPTFCDKSSIGMTPTSFNTSYCQCD